MASSPNFWQRFLHKNAPSREEVLRSPWLKPFGERIRHSELWRFTRRSVPRGVFAGLLIGIFLMVPGIQIVGAALLCVPLRGNIPINFTDNSWLVLQALGGATDGVSTDDTNLMY